VTVLHLFDAGPALSPAGIWASAVAPFAFFIGCRLKRLLMAHRASTAPLTRQGMLFFKLFILFYIDERRLSTELFFHI
jgi:hypothetical protein